MRILFFAQIKDITGCAETSLAPDGPLAADQLWATVLERFPGLANHRHYVRLSCNREYARTNTLFHPDDEVGFIPPVSGG